MAKRKMLFVVFTDDVCKLNHAFMYALDFSKKGHEVKLVLDGFSTKSIRNIADRESMFSKLFTEAMGKGIVAGACERSCHGCNEPESDRNVVQIAKDENIPLISGMNGHASITSYIDDGFELVVF